MTTSDIPLGTRVVIRYRRVVERSLPSDHLHGRTPPLTDVIGELLRLDPLTVRKADGECVEIPRERVLRMKALGPRPQRRNPPTTD